MLGFILSKMNLLILVVAIFAIVSFFLFGLIDIMKINEAQLVLDRITRISYTLVNSPSYCDSATYTLPDAIKVSGSDFYYVLKVSKETVELDSGEELNLLIYSIFSRKELTKSIAADSFRTDAEIIIYSREYEVSGSQAPDDYFGDNPEEVEVAWIDPQTRSKVDSVVLVKEKRSGQVYLYIILCHSALCESRKEYVGCLVRGYTNFNECQAAGAGFNC